MATETKVKKVKAFWWLSGITIAYFVVYYLLIVETQACDGVRIQNHWFHGFWDRYLGCRSVNELGDALAGAFAPVAFLWLAGAVFIQSKELEAQRDELSGTRAAMLDQVKEMQASTALLRQQTDALKKDQARKDAEEADKEFDAKIEATFKLFCDVKILYLVQQSSTKSTTSVQRLPPERTTLFDIKGQNIKTCQDLMDNFRDGARRVADFIESNHLGNGYQWSWSANRSAQIIGLCLKNLSEQEKALTPAHAWKRKLLGVEDAHTLFSAVTNSMKRRNVAAALAAPPER